MKFSSGHINVGVSAIVFNKVGQIFLGRREPLVRNEFGHWEFPVGIVDFGQSLAQAVVREFCKKYAMEIGGLRLLNTAEHILRAEG